MNQIIRWLPAIALLAIGYVTVDLVRRCSRDRQQTPLDGEIKTWEGEGGNLHPAAAL